MPGGLLATLGYGFDDEVAVDSQPQGPAHPGVGQDRIANVELEVIGPQIGFDLQGGMFLIAVESHFGNGHGLGEVQLAGAEGALLRFAALGGIKEDLVEPGPFRIPIVWVFHDVDVAVDFPVAQLEGAVGHQFPGTGPAGGSAQGFSLGSHGFPLHGKTDGMGQQAEQVGGGMVQLQLQGAVVQGLYAHVLEGDFAPVTGGGVFQEVEEIGIGRGYLGGERSLKAVGEIRCLEGLPIAPFQVGSQVEGIGQAVGGDVPGFRRPGDGVEVGRVLSDEALEQGG